MKNRFKQIRLHSDIALSQEAFGKRLGVTGAAISRIESGNREPSEQIILSVCREFNVNEKWLRTGEGGAEAMFLKKTREEEIAAFLSDLRGGPDFRQKFISVLSRMTEDEWAILEKKVLELAREVQRDSAEKQAREEAKIYYHERLSEKEPDTPVSFVKESGAV